MVSLFEGWKVKKTAAVLTCRLRVTYRAGPPTSHVDQLSMVHAYKQRFDPYRVVSPLLGGQDIIELACATFPGCEMAKVGDDYQLIGLKERSGSDSDWEKTLEGVAEPVRAAAWSVLLLPYHQCKRHHLTSGVGLWEHINKIATPHLYPKQTYTHLMPSASQLPPPTRQAPATILNIRNKP